MLDRQQKRRFAEEGYVVVPRAVPRRLVEGARREATRLLALRPPPAGHAGPHFYVLEDCLPAPLLDTFFASRALAVAESLIEPGRFEAPEHVQVSLNIPPFYHRPGGPHIDGLAPPEPGGRPGTFTLLAGVFLTYQEREDVGNLWVWPGTHARAALYFRERGAVR